LIAASTLLSGPGWIPAWLNLSREILGQSSGHGFDAIYSFNLRPLFTLIPGIDGKAASTLQTGVSVLLAALVGWLWWRFPPAALATPAGGRLLALTTLAMVLAPPVLSTHDLVSWVVAAAFVLAPGTERETPIPRRTWVLFCWVGWLLTWPALTMMFASPVKLPALYMLGAGVLLLLSLRQRWPGPTLAPAQV
jgi:hypothetical protein